MTNPLELSNLSVEPYEEWRRMLRFVNLTESDWAAMTQSAETLLGRAKEFVVQTYDYLSAIPETAAILGWESGVDDKHLEERRRFFTIWLARTLGLDTSDEFAYYLFRAGKYHAGHGPRKIHTPPAYITASVGMVPAAFSQYLLEAGFPADVQALAIAGWSKYLSVQLNQMHLGYQIALEHDKGEISIQFTTFGRMRSVVGKHKFTIPAAKGANTHDVLVKFFNYYPLARAEALERIWHSEEKSDSLWPEVIPAYIPHQGWRVLLNGRDISHNGGFIAPVEENDEIAIFPPGR